MHGQIDCAVCFPPGTAWGAATADDGWQLERNPCAWGSRNAVVVVLGFSKGRNQSITAAGGPAFDAIAFRAMRGNLTRILARLGVLGSGDEIDRHIYAAERDLAFGSLIRCSISKHDVATGRYVKSGDVIHALPTHQNGNYIERCARRFFSILPPRLRLVVMLSNDAAYVEACRAMVVKIHSELLVVKPVAYRTGAVMWVHVIHPSGASGKHVPAWLDGRDGTQAQKRQWAMAAVAECGLMLPISRNRLSRRT